MKLTVKIKNPEAKEEKTELTIIQQRMIREKFSEEVQQDITHLLVAMELNILQKIACEIEAEVAKLSKNKDEYGASILCDYKEKLQKRVKTGNQILRNERTTLALSAKKE